MANASQTRLAYIPEVTYGVTPATPAFQVMRMTGESLRANAETVSSDEIRADRNVSDMVRVAQDAGGDIGVEMSYGSFDTFLEALLQGTWTSNVLKNGTTQRSFTVERTIQAVAAQYHRFTGTMINTFQLALAAREKVKGSFGVLSNGSTSAQAIISGATYVAANSNPIMNAAGNFSNFTITGLTDPQARMLNLNITNNMAQRPVMGTLNSKGVLTGRFVVTGEIELYFEDQAAYELFLADTYADLSFTIGGVSDKKYEFFLPKMKFTTGETPSSGNDQDIMARFGFQGVYDSTVGSTLRITRTP